MKKIYYTLTLIFFAKVLAQEATMPPSQQQQEPPVTPLQQSVVIAMNAEEVQTCTICQEPSDAQPVRTLECQHTFHEACINKWLEKADSCPLCRQIITQNAPQNVPIVAYICVIGGAAAAAVLGGLLIYVIVHYNIPLSALDGP